MSEDINMTSDQRDWLDQIAELVSDPPEGVIGYIAVGIPTPDGEEVDVLGHPIGPVDEGSVRKILDEVWKDPMTGNYKD